MEKQGPTEKNFKAYDAMHFNEEEMLSRSSQFYLYMDKRRSLRSFSAKQVPLAIIENAIKTASTAPSGAHKQPWSFCVIQDQKIKKAIREAAEKEEYENYHGRMKEEWLEDLEKFDTDWHKEFLEIAPYLIVVFKKPYELEKGDKKKNYYVNESVGLAAGFLLTALHNAGLAALTHTPSPMNFLAKILNRPENEKPFLLIPVGYPAENALVPKLERKALNEIMTLY
jgi:nitroreductase